MKTNNFKNRLLSVALMVAMIIVGLGFMGIANTAYAAENEITVYVTISDKGELAVDANGQTMAYVPVDVPADENGTATVDAVMKAFHEVYCPGGYATEEGAWGLTVNLLWNVANDYGYSFAINNVPLSLGVGQDVVGDGGYVYGYIMKDIAYWTDSFAYAVAENSVVGAGESAEVTFSYIGYDPVTWEQSVLPLANVSVKAAGSEEVLATTDTEGKAEISFAEAGTYIVYAENPADAATTFSAPACVITVEAEDGEGGEEGEEPPILDDEEQGGDEAVDEEDSAVEEESDDEENAVDEDAVTEDEPTDEEDEDVQIEEEKPVVDEEVQVEEDIAEEETPAVNEDATENESEKAPATGDASQMAMYLLMFIAAAGTAFAVKKQK